MIEFPIGKSKQASLDNVRASGTAYPVSAKLFWHNGIHLTGNVPLPCVYDGLIVAARLEKEYKEIEVSDLSVDALQLFDRRMANEIEAKKGDYFDEKEKNGKKVLSLNGKLDDEKKKNALRMLKALFSGSFVLIQHKHQNIYGTEITFFSLYHHLRPISEIPLHNLISLSFFTINGTCKSSVYYGIQTFTLGFISYKYKIIPCETKVIVEGECKAGEEVIINWEMNGHKERAKVKDGDVIRIINNEHKEIKRITTDTEGKRYCDPANFQKSTGMLLYSTGSKEDRVAIGIIEKGDTFDLTDAEKFFNDAVDAPNNMVVMKVRVLSGNAKGLEGYIYTSFPYDVLDKHKEVRCQNAEGNERVQQYLRGNKYDAELEAYKMGFKIALRDGFSYDKVCAPKERAIRAGDKIGYPGLMAESKEISHMEIFTSDDGFLKKDTGKDKVYPCEYKTLSDYTARLKKPTTATNAVNMPAGYESFSAPYVICFKTNSVRLVSDEEYYEVDYVAKRVHSNCWIERYQHGKTWLGWKALNNDGTDGYYTVSGAPAGGYEVSLYTEEGEKIADVTTAIMYKELTYHYLDEKKVTEKIVDAEGKTTEGKEIELRKLENLYEKIPNLPAMCVSVNVVSKKATLRYAATCAYDIKSGESFSGGASGDFVTLGDVLYSEETKSIPKDTILLDTGESVKLYPRKDATAHNAIWIKLRPEESAGGENGYWINQSQIGTTIEQRPYNDWLKFFRKIENKKGCYRIDDFGTLIKDNETLLNTANLLVKKVFYSAGSAINQCSDLERYLETLIVKNASEWKKDDGLTKEIHGGNTLIKKRVETIRNGACFWDEAKGVAKGDKAISFPSSETTWYFHPIQFLEHLGKIGVYELNPYKGVAVTYWRADGTSIEKKATDNPGFAPKDRSGVSKYVSGTDHYAVISGAFNEDYTKYPELGYQVKNEHYYHEGLDLLGETGDAVYSLINGEVLAYGWFGPYGQTVFVANTQGVGVYLLAHLSAYASGIKVGMRVAPGNIIGKVGGTGIKDNKRKLNAYGSHLHITYYDYVYRVGDDVVKCSGDTIVTGTNNNDLIKKRRNPLFHGATETKYTNVPKKG